MQSHGGDLDRAKAQYGGEGWIDLSTGINRVPYPVPPIAASAWQALPTAEAQAATITAAQRVYDTAWPGALCAGAQAAIDLLPRLAPPGRVQILSPTYSEHDRAFSRAGWVVEAVSTLEALGGAEATVVVSPNNPDGRAPDPDALRALAAQTGRLVVDESFMDPTPERSLLRGPCLSNVMVLRSLGKFYGLAGARIGFAFGAEAAMLREAAGPWPVAGPSLTAAQAAFADNQWADTTRERLTQEVPRLDALGAGAGWRPMGGTALFRLFETDDAGAAQALLADQQIWTRRFDYSATWLRLGLPGGAEEWARLEAALGRSG